MAKVFNYVILMTGMLALLSFAGIQTPVSGILDQLGLIDSPEEFTTTNFYLLLFSSVFTLAGAGAIIVGLFTRQSTESILLIGFVSYALGYIATMISIITYVNANYSGDPTFGWVRYIIILVLGPLVVGYLFAIASFWRGSDG